MLGIYDYHMNDVDWAVVVILTFMWIGFTVDSIRIGRNVFQAMFYFLVLNGFLFGLYAYFFILE